MTENPAKLSTNQKRMEAKMWETIKKIWVVLLVLGLCMLLSGYLVGLSQAPQARVAQGFQATPPQATATSQPTATTQPTSTKQPTATPIPPTATTQPTATLQPTAKATQTMSSAEIQAVRTLLAQTAVAKSSPSSTPAPKATIQPTARLSIDNALKAAGQLPFTTVVSQDENGRKVTLIKGFDTGEFGGNDTKCIRKELDSIHIGEVVGSQSEGCLTVLEWSLKVGEETAFAGTYALHPGEWFYIPLAVAGINDRVRIVGTLWYLPKGWNAHMFAADLAGDRDLRDGTTSIVGLSPTDPWVVNLAKALAGNN